MGTFAPTNEQQQAIDLFKLGGNMVIEAGAGTGKTYTLKLLAESRNVPMQYIAFNRAIVEESRAKMPGHVSCRTAHSLAFQAVGKRYSRRLRSKRMKSIEIARMLGVGHMTFENPQGGRDKMLGAGFLAGVVMRAIRNFCQSAATQPTESHVPYLDGIDEPKEDGSRRYTNNNELRAYLMPFVERAWDDLQKINGTLTFGHDHYLKIYQLSNPKIAADVILFDEAQDANPVIAAIVAAQEHAQLVYVGDSQQQIYAFTGAVNAIEGLAGERTYLSHSFRFGQTIADCANVVLRELESKLDLTGSASINSGVAYEGEPHEVDAILCRTNATALTAALKAQKEGVPVHVVGGGAEIASFTRAAAALMNGVKVEHRDLACFDSWDEVQDYVKLDEQGDELALNVRLIDEYGTDTILAVLGNMCHESEAKLIVSTAHKSKGREWPRVRLGSDFPTGTNKDGEPVDVSAEELRLLYVAVTRARDLLDLTAAPLIHKLQLGKDAGFVADHVEVIGVDLPRRPMGEACLVKMIWPDGDTMTVAYSDLSQDDQQAAKCLAIGERVIVNEGASPVTIERID